MRIPLLLGLLARDPLALPLDRFCTFKKASSDSEVIGDRRRVGGPIGRGGDRPEDRPQQSAFERRFENGRKTHFHAQHGTEEAPGKESITGPMID